MSSLKCQFRGETCCVEGVFPKGKTTLESPGQMLLWTVEPGMLSSALGKARYGEVLSFLGEGHASVQG